MYYPSIDERAKEKANIYISIIFIYYIYYNIYNI